MFISTIISQNNEKWISCTRNRWGEKNLGKPSKSDAKTSSVELCILHDQLTTNNGNFVSFIPCKGDPDEKLRQLHEICELRMNQPVDSCYRMKNIFEQVPLTLDGLCLVKTGYHRAWYAKFTGNLTQLWKKCTSTYDEESVPQVKHSSREHKPSKAEQGEHRSTFLFSAECIFCKKVRRDMKLGLDLVLQNQRGGAETRFTTFTILGPGLWLGLVFLILGPSLGLGSDFLKYRSRC